MKEKINQFAKGIFEYETPKVVVTPHNLQFSVDAGENYQGSFVLSNNQGRGMKGMVCTDCHQMVLQEASFQGEQNEISFTFRAEYLAAGEVVKGNIRVISDCGDVLLPFCATVCVPSCHVSSGKIKDLLHFSNLAKENMPEAIHLFENPHFETVFLGKDSYQKALYRGLSKGTDKGLALEEFLISVHKKVPVQLSLEKNSLHYTNCREAFMDKLAIRKNTWGYCEYEVEVDAEFITLERHQFKTTDFVGDTFQLGFVVHPENVKAGRSYARLTISNVRQTLTVDMVIDSADYEKEKVTAQLQKQQGVFELYRNFLWLQCKKISAQEYCLAVERVVCSMDKMSQGQESYDWIKRVFQIHLGIMNHLEESVGLELGQLEEQREKLFGTNPVLYCAYYYLLALWKTQEQIRQEAAGKIRECYLSREDHWLILWFLLELDDAYESPKKRQEILLEQLKKGCRSPLIYLKLCQTYQEAPELLTELDQARERCLHWGCREGILGQELTFRYTYLIGRQKNFSKLLLEDLCLIYEQSPSDDILTMICQMLMRDRKVSQDDLKWYALGIERNLKITDLYEHYMYALEESGDRELPAKVLLYFTYINHLNTSKKAMLYAYVIRKKQQDPETYEAYCQAMQRFAYEQLSEGRISENLAVVYEEFITEEMLDEMIAKKLPAVLFAREITCYNSDIIGVAVSHQEMTQEEFVPLVQGKAVVSVYTGNAQIFLVDNKSNRYSQSIDYTSNQLLHLEHLAPKCLNYAGEDTKLLLHLYEKADSMNQTGASVAELRGRVLGIVHLEKDYRKKVFATLMRYYFDNFEGDLLDYQLERMDWREVEASDRSLFVEYCAIRHCFDKGMEGIMAFGFERIEAKRLLQISADTFRRFGEKEDTQLVKLAWYIFKKGKFDEYLLRYLCDYFTGSVHEMVQIWRAAVGFGIDVLAFSERILAQIVFTEEMPAGGYEVFYSYYEKGFNKKLIRALLKMLAYKYLVKGWSIPEEVFHYFYKDVRVEENRPCLLAALCYLSQKKQLTGEETVFVDYNIHQLFEKNIIFGFYRDFYGKVSLPQQLLENEYIEYTANPASDVKIQYRIISKEKKGEYITETMSDTFEGMRVKTIVLFQDEILQYRILETEPDGTKKKSETFQLRHQEQIPKEGNTSWYLMLNQMMLFRENGDTESLLHTMQEYAEKREIVKQLIKPLQKS